MFKYTWKCPEQNGMDPDPEMCFEVECIKNMKKFIVKTTWLCIDNN